MAKRTTVVFDTMLALFDLLDDQTWPAHPTTGETPLVSFGGGELLQEGIWLNGVLPDQASQQRVTFGASSSKDETFTLRVTIIARVVGQERREAVVRIKELHAIVEGAVRDQTTGLPTGGFVAAVGGVQYMTCELTTTTPIFGPLLDGGDGAACDIDIQFNARI